jgi:hypothetical protein
MTALLLLLIASLLAAQWACGRAARRTATRMMARPVEDWDGEDVDHWLALIEPFPLPDPDPTRPGHGPRP